MNNVLMWGIIIKNGIVNYYNRIIMIIFGFRKLVYIQDGHMYNGIWSYMVYMFITRCIDGLKYLRGGVDIGPSMVHVDGVGSVQRSIIMGDVCGFKQIVGHLGEVEFDDTMVTCVFIKFMLVGGSESVCLKKFIMKYKDVGENYNNTMENILLFNGIVHDDESKLVVKFYRNRKMVDMEVLLRDVLDKHINYFMNL